MVTQMFIDIDFASRFVSANEHNDNELGGRFWTPFVDSPLIFPRQIKAPDAVVSCFRGAVPVTNGLLVYLAVPYQVVRPSREAPMFG